MQYFDTVCIRGSQLALRRIPCALAGAPTIVFLHEALGSIGQWKSFPDEFCDATQCRGLVYDRAGHGHSSATTRSRSVLFYRDEADMLRELLAHERISRPVLFGHSDGATIALSFGGRSSELPRGIISEAAHVMVEPIMRNAFHAATQAYSAGDLRRKLARYHGDKTDGVFFSWQHMWKDAESAGWDMFEELRAIHCPVLALQGTDDAFGTTAQLTAISRECPVQPEILLIPDCGHVPHLQARALVMEKGAAFIHSLP